LGARKGPPCGSGESAVSPPPTERGHPRSGGRRLVERITDEIIRSGDYRTAAAFDVYEINANLAVCGHANVSRTQIVAEHAAEMQKLEPSAVASRPSSRLQPVASTVIVDCSKGGELQ
jgi:hypothetical protein